MGEVYLAEDTKLHRRVAIKLLKYGLGTAHIIRHFQQEQRILAGLTHPNIAQLHGGDVTSNGLPYFVMEYVDGTRLDDYCRDNKLSVPPRLALFEKICSAVAYAHQRLVIHRDIKPANIRVTSRGEPKLLDFGIAKLLDDSTSSILEQTITFAAVMTPEYASPEQLRGENMTTASDVYSLGVVLYELLTGQKPYKIDLRTPTNIARAITEQEPTRPSRLVASTSSRWFTGWKPVPHLHSDLDNIVMKALRKEPERRYESVERLSEDVRRHLEGRPILARKDTLGYRRAKFIGRHRLGMAGAIILLLSLLGGIIGTGWEAHRANRRFNQVRHLANSLMFEIHDSVKDLQGSTPTRRLIVSRALEYLDSLAQDASGDRSLQRELATAYEKIGDIQGNPFFANLGDTDGALVSYGKALAIREGLILRDQTTDGEMELGRSYRAVGDILEQKGDIKGTIDNYRRSLAIFNQLAASEPANFAVADELARAHEVLSDGLGRVENANAERSQNYESALAIRQHLLSQNPADRKLRRSVAVSLLKVAGTSNAKDEGAIEKAGRGLGIFEALAAEDTNNARARREVGFAYYQLGQMQMAGGNYPAALQSRRKAFAIRREFAAQDPKNAQARFDVAVAHGDLSETLTATGFIEEALDHARQALSLLGELSAADPTNAVYQRNLGLCHEKVGEAYVHLAADEKRPLPQRAKDWNQARSSYQKGSQIFSALRDHGTLMPSDTAEPQKFADRIADCDKAISQLQR